MPIVITNPPATVPVNVQPIIPVSNLQQPTEITVLQPVLPIGTGAGGNSVTLENARTGVFTVVDDVTTSIDVGTTISSIVLLTINGLEYYEDIHFTFTGSVISFIDPIPYEAAFGNTTVKVIYNTISVNNSLSSLTMVSPGVYISIDASAFDNNLDNTITTVQLLANAVDNLSTSGGSMTPSTYV